MALDDIGADVAVIPVDNKLPNAPLTSEKAGKLRHICRKTISQGPKILVHHLQPHTCDPRVERSMYDKVVCMTYCETVPPPAAWRPMAMHYDAIMVSSKMNMTSFNELTNGRVHVERIPHGVSKLPTALQPPPFFPHSKKVFYFLTVGAWQHRKGPDLLLEAFWREFYDVSGVALICKFNVTSDQPQAHREVRDRIREMKRKLFDVEPACQVYVTTDNFNDMEMAGLYQSCQAFVLPTRGEGICLPLFEAAHYSLPIIATDWGGHTEWLGNDNSFPVHYKTEPATAHESRAIAPVFPDVFTSDTHWAEPSLQHLQQQMRCVVDHYAEAEKRAVHAKHDLDGVTWQVTAHHIQKFLDTLAQV